MTADKFDDVDVSLEPQLFDALRPLPPLLPSSLADQLSPHLPSREHDASIPSPSSISASALASPSAASASSEARAATIPYTLLLSISKWSRTAAGEAALAAHIPPLAPQAYTMVSLLAGTRTSPNRKFPTVQRRDDDHRMQEVARGVNDKRAIIAVLNGLLSVGGAGAAAWVAAQRTGWRDEWKVLFALLAATIVATSEVVLYILWESRRSGTTVAKRRVLRGGHRKKIDEANTASSDVALTGGPPSSDITPESALPQEPSLSDGKLRRRAALPAIGFDED
ncbi:hypothetical protein DENSPDRAFT_542851 [Dentipellis sp. KUC8613]|nr:hypothetical protein DENSPDRAFT_542851 [Dentipellis sp. KUC8613]